MTIHDDCTGYDFVAGAATGLRGFNVDNLGRLKGVHYQRVWRPGENVADCSKRDEPGRCGDDSHGCGFWAFHNGALYESGRIHGVIKGYGRTTVGTKGFRCEKAEIVALATPGRLRRRDLIPAVGAALGVVGVMANAASGHWLWFAVAFVALVTNIAILAFNVKSRTRFDPKLAAKIRRNYPAVKTYSTVAAMKKAHPVDPSLEPTPETDPEFWETPEGVGGPSLASAWQSVRLSHFDPSTTGVWGYGGKRYR